MDTLRIITINTAKGDGPYSRRLDLLASELGDLDPDVVLLQEALATENGSRHTARRLAARLGMQATFSPARLKHRHVEGTWTRCWSGLGLLSRHPIRETTRLALPFDEHDGERVAQLSYLEWVDLPILIVNLHLSHLRRRDDLRREQIRTLFAHPWFRRSWALRMVGGDLNTPVDDLPTLLGDYGEWYWQDAYLVGGGAASRSTVPVPSHPRNGRCIDFILSIAGDPSAHPEFRGARTILGNSWDGVYPSDHLGVMVELVRPEVNQ